MKTARNVVAEELIRWLDAKDYTRLGETQRLEESVQIWEYGKWCWRDGWPKLGYPQQIKFRGSRPESTAFDAIIDMPDDEALKIDAALQTLTRSERNIIALVYLMWEPINHAIKRMHMGRDEFFAARRQALCKVDFYLRNNC